MIAVVGILLLLQFVFPTVLLKWVIRQTIAPPAEESIEILVKAYRSHVKLAWALCNGATSVALFGYISMGNPVFLLVAGVVFMIMIDRFPTQAALTDWVQQQQRRYRAQQFLEEMRESSAEELRSGLNEE
jgi:antibiotic biosynthesis monooxygenase (ABM) superfamily enzyme